MTVDSPHVSEPSGKTPEPDAFDPWEGMTSEQRAKAIGLENTGISVTEIMERVGFKTETKKEKKARKKALKALMSGVVQPVTQEPELQTGEVDVPDTINTVYEGDIVAEGDANIPIPQGEPEVDSISDTVAKGEPQLHQPRDPSDDSVDETTVRMIEYRAENTMSKYHITREEALADEWRQFYSRRARDMKIFLHRDEPLPHLRPPHVLPPVEEPPQQPSEDEPF